MSYQRGLIRAPNKDHLIDLSHRRHRARLQMLNGFSTPASWDSRTLGLVGPIKDQGQCGSCFKAGTLIRMADGSQKSIEQITTSDSVLTAEGNIGRVSQTMRRHAKEPLLTLVMWGHYHLQATAEHPIFTKRGYVKLQDVQPGDWVAFPRYAPESMKMIQTNEYIFERTHGKNAIHAHRNWSEEQFRQREVSVVGRKKVTIKTTPMPDVIHLTPGFGRLAGLYLAEGSTDRSKVCWSFNIREKDTLAAEVAAIAKDELGMEAHIAERSQSKGVSVTIYGARIARLFETLFSQGAGSKRIHPDLASGPQEFLKGMLTGWMDGDKHREGSAVSISRKLALGMFDIANAVGMMPSLSTHQKGKTGKDGIFREHAWRVSVNDPDTYKRGAAVQDDKHMWRKVCEVTEEPFEGDVFNLEVEGDHSYVAEGVGVHNCWDFSGTFVVEVAYNKAGIGGGASKMILSEEYTLSCARNGGCNGDDNVSVLDWAKATGLPLTADYGPYKESPGKCLFNPNMTLYKIDDWGFADSNGGNGITPTQDIKNAIVAYGCVGCAVAAGSSWDSWSSDPNYVHKGTSTSIDHDVALVGWDDSKGAWIMRNQWGTSFGNGGYGWIAYGADSIGTEAVWAIIHGSAPVIDTPINWYS